MGWLNDAWHWMMQSGDGSFQGFFVENLRDNLFNGLLTLGGFLFAAYTFIVIHMKSYVYDTPEYQKTFKEKLAADSRLKLYGPLQKMSAKLFFAVIITIIAALMQITVGLWKTNLAALISSTIAVYAFVKVSEGLAITGINMKAWFQSLDKHGAPKP